MEPTGPLHCLQVSAKTFMKLFNPRILWGKKAEEDYKQKKQSM